MKHIFIVFTFLSMTLFAQSNFSPYETKILAISKDGVIITNNHDIAVGTTGVIVHHFDQEHQTIIASVEVIKKGSEKLLLKVSPFKMIAQEALPTYDIKPQVGDSVLLNFLYHRALAIVPDEETYKLVTKSYDAFSWVHPDIFASALAKSYTPSPSKASFQKECLAQNVGLLLFAIKDKGYFVDCHSFKRLSTIPLPPSNKAKTPFYNRLETTIKGRIFGLFGGKKIKDYNHFYSKLLGIE